MIATTLTHSKELWYLMRASGLVALGLLSLTVVGGIVNVRRFATPRWPRPVTALLHRNVALLAVVFLAVHVATAALDSYVAVGWLAAVVPFTSGWDRLWVGLGTASVDLMIALVATSLLRARLTYRAWKAIHWLAYAAWPLALVHGWAAGTDRGTPWARGLFAVSLLSVAGAVVWRVGGRRSTRPTGRRQPLTGPALAASTGPASARTPLTSPPPDASPARPARPVPGPGPGPLWRLPMTGPVLVPARRGAAGRGAGYPGPEAVGRLLPLNGGPSYRDHLDRLGPMSSVDGRLIAAVSASGLRGRGGAGFPTGRKMDAVAHGRHRRGCRGQRHRGRAAFGQGSGSVDPQSAPGARWLGRGSRRRGGPPVDHRHRPVRDRHRGRSGPRPLAERPDGSSVEVVHAPSRYVAGQETALVSWINGGEARPKYGLRPYENGVGHRPTLVDNVETLAHVGLIARFGADWFRLLGPADEPGSLLVTLTGDTDRPGVYEVPVATSLHELLARAGVRSPRAVLVGGYFGTWIERGRIADLSLCSQSLAVVGARPGAGVVVALPENACALSEVAAVARWYAAQSAGQCGACTFGLPDIARAVEGIRQGDPGAEAAARRWTAMVRGRGACQLPDGAAAFVDSALEAFAAEVSDHRQGRCRRPPAGCLPVPSSRRLAMRSFRLVVDPTACDGHGLCEELFPEGVALDDWGFPVVARSEVPLELLAHARRAVTACPALALRLVSESSPARGRLTSRTSAGRRSERRRPGPTVRRRADCRCRNRIDP